ncbi:MAG: guanylate kinase [Planctomycetota bacterium]|jgi:guanylate kinase
MPKLVVVSGPSGVGKTTVCDLLLQRSEFERVVTATTRAPRAGERDGIDYHFLDATRFDEWIAAGRFLEWAEVFGNKYGSPRAEAEAILGRGRYALLNIDVQGAASISVSGMPCLRVFLLPPSAEELESRLRGRGSDAADEIANRLRVAKAELARQGEFDLRVVNDDAQRAADEIAATAAGP